MANFDRLGPVGLLTVGSGLSSGLRTRPMYSRWSHGGHCRSPALDVYRQRSIGPRMGGFEPVEKTQKGRGEGQETRGAGKVRSQ